MRDDHHRLAPRREIRDDREHLSDETRIERRRRLIEQQHHRLHRERARDRDALLLSTGERVGRRFGECREADALEQGARPRVGSRRREPEHMARRLGDVPERREVREEMEALEDHPDAAAHGPQRRRVRALAHPRSQPVTRDLHLARGERREIVHRAEERRLPAARRPDDRHHLAAPHLEVDPPEHALPAEPALEAADRHHRAVVHAGAGASLRSRRRASRESG